MDDELTLLTNKSISELQDIRARCENALIALSNAKTMLPIVVDMDSNEAGRSIGLNMKGEFEFAELTPVAHWFCQLSEIYNHSFDTCQKVVGVRHWLSLANLEMSGMDYRKAMIETENDQREKVYTNHHEALIREYHDFFVQLIHIGIRETSVSFSDVMNTVDFPDSLNDMTVYNISKLLDSQFASERLRKQHSAILNFEVYKAIQICISTPDLPYSAEQKKIRETKLPKKRFRPPNCPECELKDIKIKMDVTSSGDKKDPVRRMKCPKCEYPHDIPRPELLN